MNLYSWFYYKPGLTIVGYIAPDVTNTKQLPVSFLMGHHPLNYFSCWQLFLLKIKK